MIALNSSTLNTQYYKQLAREAALAGAAVAKSCIGENVTTWTELTPQYDCVTGTTSGSPTVATPTNADSVGTQDNWASTYRVSAPDLSTDPERLLLTSTGTVTLYSDPPTNTVPIIGKEVSVTVKVAYQKKSSTGPSVSTALNVGDVSAGQNSMCAVAEGWAYCWGNNAGGQVGDGTTTQRNLPTAVRGAGADAVSGYCDDPAKTPLNSSSASCPQIPNSCGWFGLGCKYYNVVQPFVPAIATSAMNGHTVTKVARGNGNHTCAIADGKAYCWGANGSGQLGTGNNTDSAIPAEVFAPAGASPVNGLCSDGTALTSSSMQCPENKNECSGWIIKTCKRYDVVRAYVPGSTAGALAGHTVTDISVGADHTCAVADGVAYCWGANDRGQLGTNNRTASNKPVAVNVGSSSALNGKVLQTITAGSKYTCALNTLATSQCWGKDEGGQLGDSIAPPPSSTAINHSGGTASKDYGPNNMQPVGYYRATAICTVAGTFNNNKPTPDPSVTDTLLPVDVNMRSSKYSRTWSYGTFTIPIDRSGSPLSGTAISSVKAGGYITPVLANGKLYWFGGPDHTEDRNNNVSGYYETCSTYYSKYNKPCYNSNANGDSPMCGDQTVGSTDTWVTLKVGTSVFDDGSLLGVYSLKYVYHMNSTATPLYASSSNLAGKTITQAAGQNQSSDGNALCMLVNTGELYCGGGSPTGNVGQLGNGNTAGTRTSSSDVVAVKMNGALAGKTVTRIVSNSTGDYTCVLATDPATAKGGVYCWGSGSSGRTGMGDTSNRYEPTSINLSTGSALGGGTTPGPTVTRYVNPVMY